MSLVPRSTGSSLIISTSGGSLNGVPVGAPAASGRMPDSANRVLRVKFMV